MQARPAAAEARAADGELNAVRRWADAASDGHRASLAARRAAGQRALKTGPQLDDSLWRTGSQPLRGHRVELNEILKIALKGGASDIHLKPGLPAMFRVDGALVPLKSGERHHARRGRSRWRTGS